MKIPTIPLPWQPASNSLKLQITHFTVKCDFEPPIPTTSLVASVALVRNCSLFASTSAKTLPPLVAWTRFHGVWAYPKNIIQGVVLDSKELNIKSKVGSDLLVWWTGKEKKSSSSSCDLPWLRAKYQSYLSQSEILSYLFFHHWYFQRYWPLPPLFSFQVDVP